MLYFDQIENDRFGTIRQQIWALLHFPLHIAILLTVEGSSQFIIWWMATDLSNFAINTIINVVSPDANVTALVSSLKEGVNHINTRFTGSVPVPDFNSTYTAFINLAAQNLTNTDEVTQKSEEIAADFFGEVLVWIFENLRVEVPAKELSTAKTAVDKSIAIYSVFVVVFIFFFTAAGVTLIMLGVMYWFGKSHKTKGELLSIVVRVIAGIGLSLLSIMAALDSNDTTNTYMIYNNFIGSPWVLPTVLLAFALGKLLDLQSGAALTIAPVIFLDNALVWSSNKRLSRQNKMNSIEA